MMIDSIPELGECKVKEYRRSFSTQVKNALFSGVAMSLTAVVVWFLISRDMKGIGGAMLITSVALLAFDALVSLVLKSVRRALKTFATILLVFLNAAVFLSVTIYVFAPTQLFYPHFDEESYAELKTRSGTEQLMVNTENGNLSGWMLHNAEDSAPLVLYFCGNGENASTRMLRILDNDLLEVFAGYNIAIFDYPGYGKTDGSPSEKALKNFGLDVFDALSQRDDVDKGRIIVFGYSIGTGVADYVASKRNPVGLILMAPYSDGYDLYNGYADIFHGPLRILVAFRMESVQFAEDVSLKPLILASESDESVNYDSSVRLSHAFPSGSTLRTLDGMGHNDFWGSDTVLEYISEYLAEVNV